MKGREALAKAFDEWFAQSGMSQVDVAAAGGPSTTTQTKVRKGNDPISRQTLKQLDAVTEWGTGVAARIYSGEIPGPPTPPRGRASDPSDSELLAILARRLGLAITIDDEPGDRELPSP